MLRALAPLCLVGLATAARCPDRNPFPSVEVSVKRAYGYENHEGWLGWFGNKPDPYVAGTLHNEERATETRHSTDDAHFQEVWCFQGAVSVQAFMTEGMTLTLMDHDTNSDDTMATFAIAAGKYGDVTVGAQTGTGSLQVLVQDVAASDAAQEALHPEYKKEGAVVYYPASYVLPSNVPAGTQAPFAVGSPDNMDDAKNQLGLDFEGVWWMSDNPVPEELVSFAGGKVNSTTSFPTKLMAPMERRGQWSWLTSTVGDMLRRYYSAGSPQALKNFTFVNAEAGAITTGLTDVPLIWVQDGFPFYKLSPDCDVKYGKEFCDPTQCATTSAPGTTCAELMEKYPNDMWSRPTVFDKDKWAANVIPYPLAPFEKWGKPWWADTRYTLKRIVLADGSPHPVFWNEWLEHMKGADGTPGGKMMQSFADNDWCGRIEAAGWVSTLLDTVGMGAGISC